MDTLMEKAITDLRNLSHSLDSDLIRNKGWLKASEKIFSDLQKAKTHKVIIETEENLPKISNERSIILYRMIQEIVNNIIKHAFAKEIKFSAAMRDRNIIISIKDNGNGFDISAANGGAGLQNLKNRAKMIDAAIGIHSDFSQGTLVTISVNMQ
jgi:signal transduction histidine kinase